MSRLSQIIVFINAKEIPTNLEMKHNYDSISKTEELKEYRLKHQKQLKSKKDEKSKL